jgi:hypothetical protein
VKRSSRGDCTNRQAYLKLRARQDMHQVEQRAFRLLNTFCFSVYRPAIPGCDPAWSTWLSDRLVRAAEARNVTVHLQPTPSGYNT